MKIYRALKAHRQQFERLHHTLHSTHDGTLIHGVSLRIEMVIARLLMIALELTVKLFYPKQKGFALIAIQNEKGVWNLSYDKYALSQRNWRLTTGLTTTFIVIATVVSTLITNLVTTSPYVANAASYTVMYDDTTDFGSGNNSNPTPTVGSGISTASNELKLASASQSTVQTSWVGGSGQTVFSDATKYNTGSQIDDTGGTLKLSSSTTTLTEDFSATTYLDSSTTTASWDIKDRRAELSVNAPGPSTINVGTFTDAVIAPDNNSVVYAAVGSETYKSTNGGSSYSKLTTTATSNIVDIDVIDANTVWMIASTTAYVTTNGGTSWISSSTGSSQTLTDIDALDANTVVAISGLYARKTTNGGSSWSSANGDIVSANFVDISVVDANTFFIGDFGKVYKTTNGGTNWTSLTTGLTANTLYAISMIDVNTGFVIATNSTSMFKTTDGGTNWSSMGTVTANGADIDATDANTIWAVAGTSTHSWYLSTNGGTNWTTITPSNMDGSYVTTVNAISSTIAVGAGVGGQVMVTTDSGSTFTRGFSTGPRIPTEIVALSASTYLVAERDKLFRTTDRGTTWTSISLSMTSNNAADLEAVSASVVWLATDDNKIRKSTDGGLNWTTVATGLSADINDFYAGDGTTGYAVGDTGLLYKTIDGGSSWSQLVSPTSLALWTVEGIGTDTVWIGGASGKLFKSTNAGSSWTELTSGVSNAIVEVEAVTDQILYLDSGAATLRKSTNGGTSWANAGVSGGSIELDSYGSIHAQSQNVILYLQDGKINVTANGGTSWSDIETAWTTAEFSHVAMESDLNGMILGYDSTSGYYVNTISTTYNTSNSLIQSLTIDATTATISTATLTATTSTPTGTSIAFQLSANGGTNWENVTSGEAHAFTNTGSDLRWRATLTGTSTATPVITQVQVAYPAGYQSSGNLVSSIMDTQGHLGFGNASWNATLNSQTMTVKGRSSNNSDMSGAADFGLCMGLTSGNDISSNGCINDSHRYLQYRVDFSTSDLATSPILSDITFAYNQYSLTPANNTYTFILQEPTGGNAVWQSIAFAKSNDPSGTSIQMRSKTAAAQGGLASATYSSYQALGTGTTSSLNFDAGTNTDNPWIQIELKFNSTDGAQTPAIQSMTTTYVINAAPSISIDSVAQESDGRIKATYTVSDADNTSNDVYAAYNIYQSALSADMKLSELLSSNATTVTVNATSGAPSSGTLLIGNEVMTYTGKTDTTFSGVTRARSGTLAAAHANNTVVYIRATTLTGDVGTGVVVSATSISKTLYWTVKADDDGLYYNNIGKVKIVAVDNERAYASTNADSTTFSFDTKNPASPSLVINSGSSKTNSTAITLSPSVTDDSSLTMVLSNDSALTADGLNGNSGTSLPYANSRAWTIPSGDGTKTVYARYTDAKSNTTSIVNDSIVLDQTAPPVTQNFKVKDLSNVSGGIYQLAILWTPNTASDFSQYKIYRSTDGTNFSLLTTVSSVATNYYVDTGLGANTVYYYKMSAVDDVTNESAMTDVVSDTPDTFEGDIAAPVISNIQVSNITSESATVTFTTDESAIGSINYGQSASDISQSQGSPTAQTSHSIRLVGLSPSTAYYIQPRAEDLYGNRGTASVTNFTTAGVDTAGPVISQISVEEASTSALVSFTTTEAGDAFVEYGKTTEYGNGIHGEFTTATFHEVQLPNDLEPETTYHFRIFSTDSGGNKSESSGQTFTTLEQAEIDEGDTEGPEIDDVSAGSIASTSAVVKWNTDEEATSFVEIGTSKGVYTSAEGNYSLVKTHTISLENLAAGTKYYYRVRSRDEASNEASSKEYDFTTLESTSEETPPVISSIVIAGKTANAAIIAWTTDKPTDSKIEYGETISYGQSVSDAALVTSHGLALVNLSANTEYHYRVISKTASGNQSVSEDRTFKTPTSQEGDSGYDSNDPSLRIFTLKPSVSAITASSVTIAWATSVPSDSKVQYGLTAAYSDEVSIDEAVPVHIVVLTGLEPGKTYHYRVTSISTTTEDVAVSPDDIFSTVSGPTIVNNTITVSSIKDRSATIIWQTDRASKGKILYGETVNYGNEIEETTFSTAHSLELLGLKPETEYHFAAINTGEDETASTSTDQTFTTSVEPGIKNVLLTDIGLTGAKVFWKTSVPATTEFEYWMSDDKKIEITDADGLRSADHYVQLSALQSGKMYFFRVKGVTEQGDSVFSDVYQFTTLTLPVISKIHLDRVGMDSAHVTFESNVPVTDSVKFNPTGTTEFTTIAHDQLRTLHDIALAPLEDEMKYEYVVKIADQYGNIVQSSIQTFETPTDSEAPLIEKIKVEASLSSKDATMANMIVTWSTNEPSTSKVEYSAHAGETDEFELATTEDENYGTGHTVVLSNLQAGSVYRFRVVSQDVNGNIGISAVRTSLMPAEKQNVVSVIVRTLTKRFEWLNKLKL